MTEIKPGDRMIYHPYLSNVPSVEVLVIREVRKDGLPYPDRPRRYLLQVIDPHHRVWEVGQALERSEEKLERVWS